MSNEELAAAALEAHGRDRNRWVSVVNQAQQLDRDEKASIMKSIATLDVRTAARFARDAGVGPRTRELLPLVLSLEISDQSMPMENIVAAMGENAFIESFCSMRDNDGFERSKYWAAFYLSDPGRTRLKEKLKI